MPSLWSRIRPLVFFGWFVAAVRLVLDGTMHPGPGSVGWYVGLYFLMPVAFLVTGLRGTWDDVRWPKVALSAILVGLFVWGVADTVAYTTAQFSGWTHGRFEPPVYDAAGTRIGGRAPAIMPTPGEKILAGLAVGGVTGGIGAVYCVIGMTLLVWLPGLVRRKRKASGS